MCEQYSRRGKVIASAWAGFDFLIARSGREPASDGDAADLPESSPRSQACGCRQVLASCHLISFFWLDPKEPKDQGWTENACRFALSARTNPRLPGYTCGPSDDGCSGRGIRAWCASALSDRDGVFARGRICSSEVWRGTWWRPTRPGRARPGCVSGCLKVRVLRWRRSLHPYSLDPPSSLRRRPRIGLLRRRPIRPPCRFAGGDHSDRYRRARP
ncbi:hypothetical protein BH23BAC4_BH23BAC4_06050 [soil metagenome]